jgi:hypothetical protein
MMQCPVFGCPDPALVQAEVEQLEELLNRNGGPEEGDLQPAREKSFLGRRY